NRFTGPIQQVPPMYSALKKDGKPLYEYARAGETVERLPREVTIRSLVIAPLDESPSDLQLLATVSKGTYIRTLGEDIADALGCGGHLTTLRRTATGGFDVRQCVTLEELEALDDDQRLACLHPVDALLAGHTAVTLDADNAARFLSGMRRRGGWRDAHEAAV